MSIPICIYIHLFHNKSGLRAFIYLDQDHLNAECTHHDRRIPGGEVDRRVLLEGVGEVVDTIMMNQGMWCLHWATDPDP